MAKSAKAFKEGAGWAMRRRVQGQDIYVCGYRTSSDAQEEMALKVGELKKLGAPKGLGPRETTVAQALQDYGMERLPYMKGAAQDAPVARLPGSSRAWRRSQSHCGMSSTPTSIRMARGPTHSCSWTYCWRFCRLFVRKLLRQSWPTGPAAICSSFE